MTQTPSSVSVTDAIPKKPPVHQWAVALLLLSLLTWLGSLYGLRIRPEWQWLGYVKAFSEAACIGGLADWFAVVALFKHPMGLPIPHTAILPAKQAKLARGVADFIGNHFLEPQMMSEQVQKLQAGQRVAEYVRDQLTADDIAARLPDILTALMGKLPATAPEPWLRAGQKTLLEYANGERLGRGAARILSWAQSEHTDRWLVNRLAQALEQFCSAEDAAERLRPWLLQLFQQAEKEKVGWWEKLKSQMTGQAIDWIDDWLIDKLLVTGVALSQKVQQDPEHPIHHWFSAQCVNWQQQLIDNPQIHDWLAQHAGSGIEHPLFTEWLERMWVRLHGWLTDVSAQRTPQIESLAQFLYDTLNQQLGQVQRQEQLSQAVANLSARALESKQEDLRNWMTAQLNAWSKERLNDALQNAIGNDLQYIRINGTLIGGLIGLILYAVSMLLL